MLPAPHRLRNAADFAAVLRGPGRARSGGQLLVVHAYRPALETDAGTAHRTRVGFIVSKGVGAAVTRNRTKRVLRHLVAGRLTGIPAGYDLVVRAHPAAASAKTPQLAAELDRALERVLGTLAGSHGAPQSGAHR